MISRGDDGMPVVNVTPTSPYARRLVRLAFLATALQRAILAGHQPPGLTLSQLLANPIPLLWPEQVRAFSGAR